MIKEWFVENMMVIGIVLSIIWIAIMIYKYVAIKHNLPLPNWIKNLKDGGSMGGDGGPGGGGGE